MKTETSSPRRALLASLNLFGLGHLDAVVLAALADESPMLLVGAHGTAKSALLNRIAAALGLEHRHYNASLIAFDDLLGFPVPDAERRAITYLRAPGDLWDAESVFIDEISRCRPETQNKLFSIVHERRVQGQPLPRLRYRWAAMNPPAQDEGSGAEEGYEGSFALDAALADRFAWVVAVPAVADLPRAERLNLISRGDLPPVEEGMGLVRDALERARTEVREIREEEQSFAARYAEALIAPLAEASLPISGRRAGMLAKSVLSLLAASRALGITDSLEDSAATALRWGLPQRAQGRRIEQAVLTSIHRAAMAASREPDFPWHAIRAARDPVERIARALPHHPGSVSTLELSALVTEAFAALPVPEQWLLAKHLVPVATERGCLNVPAFELVSAPMAKLAEFCAKDRNTFEIRRDRMPQWNRLLEAVTKLGRGKARDAQLGNLFLALFALERQDVDPVRLKALDAQWAGFFAPAGLRRAA